MRTYAPAFRARGTDHTCSHPTRVAARNFRPSENRVYSAPMESVIEQVWWAPAALWAILYLSDYTLTHI